MPPMRRPRNRAAAYLPAGVRALTRTRARPVALLSALLLGLVLPLGPAPLQPASAARPAAAGPRLGLVGSRQLVSNGSPANRISIVLLGDGYTAAELPRYRSQAAAVWRALTEVEPFRSYQRFFDVTRLDVVSPVSGLHPGSPLGMHFGCDGLPRLLCADDGAVDRYTGRSHGPGGRVYVVALANSDSYGGEGGNGLATLAAGSPEADQIVQHEFGHSVGGLGDEYDAAPPDPGFPNLATTDAADMLRQQVKWWRWLGAADPTGGTVGAYPGGNGLYRPTRDSIMRTLGGVYNLPSREALIESLYRQVRPIDRADPAPGVVSAPRELRVFPVPLVGARQLTVDWRVDSHRAPAAAVDGDRLDTARLGLGAGQWVEVTAAVQDGTPWLRDEAFRRDRMTATVSWAVRGR
ncbi:hypothetical protein GXW83_32950 [Streptacidiphilus sp. PB12-B1b]|uniref:M64 family metallopeptidase n=1 Tax=Streptacidiphilus sp. PB12-B1b TaxID=2705012 RepID=UPI0015F896C7|nr:M64 family metallopeptidase [Streptacidiphilus sp. PB12-B1b]QMU79796.1 hypothetical protein GXW83_32950 [Streptacidiphilus sp. PB12-B1b]